MGGYIERISGEIADILLREGIEYVQTKAVFRAAREKAGLKAPKERRTAPSRLMLEEQLRFIDAAYARDGQSGLMIQALLETGTRVSEFVALRVEDVSLAERVIIIESGKGGKRREVPIRTDLARLLSMHIGRRRSGPLFVSREKGARGARVYSRQRIGQVVRGIAREAGIGKRIYPHLLRHTMATRLLAIDGHHRHPEVPRARRHQRDTHLRRDQHRHAAAQVRPGCGSGRPRPCGNRQAAPWGCRRRVRSRSSVRGPAQPYMIC